LALSLSYDGRQSIAEPTSAWLFSTGARYTLTSFDVGGSALQTGSLFAGAGRIFALADLHTFSVGIDAAVLGGDIQYRPQLLGAGGDGALPGYDAGELFGRATLLGHLEWRSVVVHDLDWNIGHLSRVRGFGVSANFDAGFVSGCDGYGDLL